MFWKNYIQNFQGPERAMEEILMLQFLCVICQYFLGGGGWFFDSNLVQTKCSKYQIVISLSQINAGLVKISDKNTFRRQGKSWHVNNAIALNLNYHFLHILLIWIRTTHPVGNYMFKVNNKNARTRCEICSKLTT